MLLQQPFGDEVSEVPLARAPLAKVIAQLTFPVIASIANQTFIADFQERLRKEYPLALKEAQAGLLLTPAGAVPQEGGATWRFQRRDRSAQVSLAPNFIALDTDHYQSRVAFFGAFRDAVAALSETINPGAFQRLGVRYVDRIESPRTLPLETLVRPEVLGHLGRELGANAVVVHAVTDTVFELDGAQLHARWGLLPANVTLDPFIEPSPVETFILDLDMFVDSTQDFDVEAIASTALGFSKRIYRFFRWATTEDFLSYYGAAE